jgi:nicotinamidase-related amidase
MEKNIDKFIKIRKALMGEIKTEETALIVVDMQKYQVKKDWTAYKAMNTIVPGMLEYFVEHVEKKVIPNLRKLIDFCREVNIPVIYTKFSSFMPDGSDLSKRERDLNDYTKRILGEVTFPHISHPSSDIIDELKPKERDLVLQKNTSGTFISTRLDSFLINMKIKTVLVTGVVTNFCVHSTAREASDYGFEVIIVDDCCAAWSPKVHEAALKSFGLLYGSVLNHEKVIKKITRTMKKVKEALTTY